MLIKRLAPFGIALFLFFASILATGPATEWYVHQWLKPGVIETASENAIPSLFQGTLLQGLALQNSSILPMYGSSEFGHGGRYNPTKLFTGEPTGWMPYLVGHAGSEDIIQALYASAQDLQGKKIALSLSAQWFGGSGIAQNTFGANFSALQAYNMLANPSLTDQTKKVFAQRLIQFNEVKQGYPILAGMLRYYGQTDLKSRLLEAAYWPMGKIELAALEIQDATKTVNVLNALPPKEVAQNANSIGPKALPSWSLQIQKANADVKKNENNNPYGVSNQYYNQNEKKLPTIKNSSVKSYFYPSPEYKDLDLLMQVLKDEGAEPIFMIQPVNGRWYDLMGFPKEQRQKYYDEIRQRCNENGFALADMSNHEYDLYFMDDPSHPSEKGWLYFDEVLNNFKTGQLHGPQNVELTP